MGWAGGENDLTAVTSLPVGILARAHSSSFGSRILVLPSQLQLPLRPVSATMTGCKVIC